MKSVLCTLLISLLINLILFGQSAQRISPAGISCIDPEIYSEGNKLAFQTSGGNIWLAYLDSTTGLFVSSTGMDVLIDTGATPLVTSFNGPEFGIDANGWSVFYTKNNGGLPQAWRATVDAAYVTRKALTSGTIPRLSILAAKSPSSPEINILFSKGASLQTGIFGFTSEDDPANETMIDSTDKGVRWIDGMRKFIYIRQTGPNKGNLFLYDTETSTEVQITSDTLAKTYCYGWVAPEYNKLICLVLLSDTIFGIYIDNGGQYWDLLYTMGVPPASGYDYIGSPEALVANGKSYISFVTKVIATGSNYVNAEVWVMDIKPDIQQRFMLRCDDGANNTKRTDPESYIALNEVFIYYNVLTSDGVFEIWRYATGISTTPATEASQINQNKQELIVHPNPTRDMLFVANLPDGFIGEVRVFNALGQMIFEELNSGPGFMIETGKLRKGVYFISLQDAEGLWFSSKFVKE